MKVLVIFLSVVAACGAAFGAYALVQLPVPAAVTGDEPAVPGQEVSNARILELKGDLELLKRKQEGLEEEMIQRAEITNEQNKRIAALEKRLLGTTAQRDSGEGSIEPGLEGLDIASADREVFKQRVSEAMVEIRQEQRQQQFQEMQERVANQRMRQVERIAEKFDWDEQKKQQVLEILAQGRQQAQQLRERTRDRELTPEEREAMAAAMREANERTQEALQAILTEEEYKGIQKMLRPRRDRRSGGRGGRGDRGGWPGSGRQGGGRRER